MGAWERFAPAFRRGDYNVDGKVDVSDGIRICWWLFLGGPDILAPGPFECGFDPEDSPHLGCESYPPCQ